MDGTFAIVRKPFSQLFTINVYLSDHVQFPGIYVLISGKSTRDYEAVRIHIHIIYFKSNVEIWAKLTTSDLK